MASSIRNDILIFIGIVLIIYAIYAYFLKSTSDETERDSSEYTSSINELEDLNTELENIGASDEVEYFKASEADIKQYFFYPLLFSKELLIPWLQQVLQVYIKILKQPLVREVLKKIPTASVGQETLSRYIHKIGNEIQQLAQDNQIFICTYPSECSERVIEEHHINIHNSKLENDHIANIQELMNKNPDLYRVHKDIVKKFRKSKETQKCEIIRSLGCEKYILNERAVIKIMLGIYGIIDKIVDNPDDQRKIYNIISANIIDIYRFTNKMSANPLSAAEIEGNINEMKSTPDLSVENLAKDFTRFFNKIGFTLKNLAERQNYEFSKEEEELLKFIKENPEVIKDESTNMDSCIVETYDDVDFKGKKNEFKGDVKVLDNSDKISSFIVKGGGRCTVQFFEHADFEGKVYQVTPEDSKDLRVPTLEKGFNDSFSSLKILSSATSNGSSSKQIPSPQPSAAMNECRVETYNDANFKGEKHVYSGDVKLLDNNDKISSFIVKGGKNCSVQFFEDADFKGKAAPLATIQNDKGSLEVPKLPSRSMNDKFSSLKVGYLKEKK